MSIAELELAMPMPVSPTAKLDNPDRQPLSGDRGLQTFIQVGDPCLSPANLILLFYCHRIFLKNNRDLQKSVTSSLLNTHSTSRKPLSCPKTLNFVANRSLPPLLRC